MKFSLFQLLYILVLGCACLFSSLHADLLLSEASSPPSSEPTLLDFDSAVTRTMNQSLNLSIAENEAQIKEGQMRQARLYPNPSFTYYLETSELGWFNRQEIYSLSQLFELGGKRQKRVQIASNEYYAASIGYEVSKLERLYQLTKAFIHAVAAQELFQIAVERQRNADEFLNVTQAKLEGGRISLIEKIKAELTQSLAHLNVQQKRATFRTAKKNLTLFWSSAGQDFDFVTYPFYDIQAPTPLEDYLARLCEQPEIIRSLYKLRAANHNVRLEKAQRIPDVTLTLGYSYDAGDNGLVAGINVPLPIWNQNQGNIKKANYELLKTDNEAKQLWLMLEAKLSNAYVELQRSYHEAEHVKDTMLKKAKEAADAALEGYREGKFDYVDVLEAKRSLFEIREKYIETLVEYHTKKAEIEFLNSQT